MRIGLSKDIHNKIEGSFFTLGGVKINANFSFEANSDGDVLLHTICEALLGAMGLDDLGTYFSSNNSEAGFSSEIIVKFTMTKLIENNYKIVNIDTMIQLDGLYLGKYKNEIKKNISTLLDISENKIAIKATTSEKNFVDFIECHSAVIIEELNNGK